MTYEITDGARHYFNPVVSTTAHARQVVAYNFSGDLDYLGIMYTDRVGAAPNWRAPRVLISGSGVFYSSRVGDYGGISPDGAKVWFMHEYATNTITRSTYWAVEP